MRTELDIYDAVVQDIYSAAVEPQRWSTALRGIEAACGGSRSLLFTPVNALSNGGLAFSNNIPQSAIESWSASAIADDPIYETALSRGLFIDGETVIGRDIVSDETMFASRLYNEVWKPLDIGHVCSGAVFTAGDSHRIPTAISIYKSIAEQRFDPSHAATLRRFLAHMSRSLGVMYHLRDAQLQVASSLAALDRMSSGIVLLDASGAINFANRVAQAMLAEGKYLQAKTRGRSGRKTVALAPGQSTLEPQFRSMLAEALAPLDAAEPEQIPGAVVLPDPDGAPACVIQGGPLVVSDGFASAHHETRAILFLYDVAAASSIRPEVLCNIFGMTMSEARAALQVVLGGTFEERAARLGVSPNTLKTQTAAAYAKTNTSRHADLLRLLLALASNEA
ncbi:MAG: LuxR family transcriptional regulator [Rhizobacter sp.]|nr:LuxR family transcriptional regulator [Rhizobacter sp.]